MKFSIASTLLILAIGGSLGLLNHRRAGILTERKQQLSAQAVSLGISPTNSGSTGENRLTKRQRDERQTHASSLLTDLIAFTAEMQRHEEGGEKPDAAFAKRTLEMVNRLIELNAAELHGIIAALRDDKSLPAGTRESLILYTMMLLAEEHPAKALALSAKSSDLLDNDAMRHQAVVSSLSSLAKQDPAAALAWLKKYAAKNPDIPDDELKQGILVSAAEKDPRLAFKLMAEMQMTDPSSAVQSLIHACDTPQQRTAILNALREHLASLPVGEERDSLFQESLETMGRSLTNEKFDSVSAWLSSAKLTPSETTQFAAGLSYFNTKEDTGRWIDWIGSHLPKDAVRENVDNLIGQWTQQDYLAAGKWLAAAPAGEAKNAAVSTYAVTVAEYEPQTAVQWALTLPAGDDRKSTLESIYQNWPKKDAPAAAAFAHQYGIDMNKN